MNNPPMVVAIEMGYGHLRAAYPLADFLGTEVLHVDRAPLADMAERRIWGVSRRVYEQICRTAQIPVVGSPLAFALGQVTKIEPLHPSRDLSAPTAHIRLLHRLAQLGLGHGMTEELRRREIPLLTTFFTPALFADVHGYEKIYCVVTDSDISRAWAPLDPANTRIHYLAPSKRAERRLRAYGVPRERVTFTGFPLPDELVGENGEAVRRNLAARLARLDPKGRFISANRSLVEATLGPLPPATRPPRIAFAVGGAGVQGNLVAEWLPSFRTMLEERRIEITLIAGVRREISSFFRHTIQHAGLRNFLGSGLQILEAETFEDYFRQFNVLMAEADILWTKPSELTFFGGLGLPLLLAPAIGVHEEYNARWAIENGAGVRQRVLEFASDWMWELLKDGTLANAAWNGFLRLPNRGLYEIAARFR